MHVALEILFNPNSLMALGLLIWSIFLVISHRILVKRQQKLTVWRLLCVVPLLVLAVHFLIFEFCGAIEETLVTFGVLYWSTMLPLIWQVFAEMRKPYIVLAVLTVASSFLVFIGTCFYVVPMNEQIYNLSRKSYTESFVETLEIMQREYALSEHKEIDYDEIYQRYYGVIAEAEQNGDFLEFYRAMDKVAQEFYDAHVSVFPAVYAERFEGLRLRGDNDYGFTTLLMDDGKVIALLVDEESKAYRQGLREGMVILERDGVAVKDIMEQMATPRQPTREVTEILKSMDLFVDGDSETRVTFLDENGERKEITATLMEDAEDRDGEVFGKIFGGIPVEMEEFENYGTKMLDEKTGYMMVIHEEYYEVLGMIATLIDDAWYIRELVDAKLQDLQEAGMERLVIDLRGNSGGYAVEGKALAEMFTDEEFEFFRDVKHGKDVSKADISTVRGNGKYKDLPILVLVDAYTVSAGDMLAYLLAMNPNVRLVGVTSTSNSAQATGGVIYLPGGLEFVYPIYNSLVMHNQILIDTDASGEATIELDEEIVLDYETMKRFLESEDYLLEYAMGLW